jgi:uridine kinase
MVDDTGIRRVPPRTTVQARFPDGRVFEAPVGTEVGAVVAAARREELLHRQAGEPALPQPPPDVAALVGGRLRELGTPLTTDADVRPMTAADADGIRIYRRSLTFLLITAAAEVFPDAAISIEHSATTVGGYYCEVRGRAPFTQQDLQRIETRMREIVESDARIEKAQVPLAEAVTIFQSRREEDKVRLLAHREKPTLAIYRLRSRWDYFQGYMVASAGCLRYFALHAFPPGFMLQFPHQSRATEVAPITPYPKLFTVFEEAGHWLDRLGIRSAGALDDAIIAGRLPEISLVAEALHEARIAQIAADIASNRRRVVLVFVAGPSASGKTTFAKRLSVQFLANGRRPLAIGLDDYFVERQRTPRDATGQPDYESLEAVDVGLFNEHLIALMDGRTVQLPRYSFVSGQRERGPTVQIDPHHIIIVEGIHGLNPALVPSVPPEWVSRVYVSALTELNLDRHNRVSTTDCRLIRRVVRDAATRGYSATETLRRWDAVTRGEKQHIFPFQEHSDAIFNSALVHELAVLRPFAEPLLLQVRLDAPEYVEANRLLSFLQWFRPAAPDPVPDNSILREFIGGSVLANLRVWPTSPAG